MTNRPVIGVIMKKLKNLFGDVFKCLKSTGLWIKKSRKTTGTIKNVEENIVKIATPRINLPIYQHDSEQKVMPEQIQDTLPTYCEKIKQIKKDIIRASKEENLNIKLGFCIIKE